MTPELRRSCFRVTRTVNSFFLLSLWSIRSDTSAGAFTCLEVPWKWKARDSLWKPWTCETPSNPSSSVKSSKTLMRRAGSTPKPRTAEMQNKLKTINCCNNPIVNVKISPCFVHFKEAGSITCERYHQRIEFLILEPPHLRT